MEGKCPVDDATMRCCNWAQTKTGSETKFGSGSSFGSTSRLFLPPILVQSIGTLSIAGLILSIVGGSLVDTKNYDPYAVNAESKAGIVIFMVVFVCVVLMLGILTAQISRVEAGERRLLLAVALSRPFIFVRLIYAVLSAFRASYDFNTSFGNVIIYLCMAVLEEIAVVIICTAVGLTLRVHKTANTDVSPGEEFQEGVSGQKSGNPQCEQVDSSPRQGISTRRQPRRFHGPISWLIGTCIDFCKSKMEQRNARKI